MEPLRLIGYWRNEQHPEYPDPHDFVDEGWDEDRRLAVAGYLFRGVMPWTMMGLSPCRICGQTNGSVEYSDGVYVWPEGLAHYVEDHFVRLPPEVEQHILDQMARYEERDEWDVDWWVTATQRSSG